MSQTISAANTTTDPTTSPSVTAVADNDIGNASNLNSPLQPILNFIAWLRAHVALLNNGGARISNVGTPTTAGDVVVYPATNAQQSFGTPSASTDVMTKGYGDTHALGRTSYVYVVNSIGSVVASYGDTTGTSLVHDSAGWFHISDSRIGSGGTSAVEVTPNTSTPFSVSGGTASGQAIIRLWNSSGTAADAAFQVRVII